jgi:hypothetical protein
MAHHPMNTTSPHGRPPSDRSALSPTPAHRLNKPGVRYGTASWLVVSAMRVAVKAALQAAMRAAFEKLHAGACSRRAPEAVIPRGKPYIEPANVDWGALTTPR